MSKLANDLLNDANLIGNVCMNNLVCWCFVMSKSIVSFGHQGFGDIDQIGNFGGVMFWWVGKVVT